MTLRSPHRLHWYSLNFIAFKRSSILPYDSFRWTECAMGMLGYLFPLCRRTPLSLRLEESMKRRQSEGLCCKPRDVNKPGMFVQLHNLFSLSKKEARSLFRFLRLVILTSSWTRFHCLSREAKSSDCSLDRYKSRARSFRFSWVIQGGSLPLVPEYVDSISSKDIDSVESSLEGISSADEEEGSLCTGDVGTGRSSEWGTGLIADRRLVYLIFFLEDALKPVILVKQK